jgi:hypothetical protein
MLSCFVAENSHHWQIRHQTPSLLTKHRTHFRFTMKFSALIAITGALAPVSAIPQYLSTGTRDFVPQEWIAPTASDCKLIEQTSVPRIHVLYANRFHAARGPCPGLNTLANHGYIPRDGKNIDLKKLAAGMLSGYNIEYSDALLLWTQAIRTSPKYPRTVSFDLADLGRHNILEHDISLRYVVRSSSPNQPALTLTMQPLRCLLCRPEPVQ